MVFDALLTYFVWRRRLRRIPALSTKELMEMVSVPATGLVMNTVLSELKTRGEDVAFSFPYVARMACSSNYALEGIGVACLRDHFPELMADLEIEGMRLTKQSKRRLQQAIEKKK